ncbi:Uncharacterized SPBc2 prophage-derived protein YoqJ [Lactobacillus bombicola]|uniref:UPF0398 protein SAMN04487792_0136 n=1 Tax=Lactobacillus bombicola TaxID=1505723 RepID=A0A1I1R4E4_9LACO|nr:DUF1273 domain-containing protein [Lactobacillus bombicola]MCO6528191.1 DUF1273 domain-containing protein [Lactobacillus sp.]SFD29155.1 Uncharacterized SPBc2 prophage-derived protein YoqJ [Lactobacillus bombicola]
MQRLWITGYRNFELNTFNDQDPKIKIIKNVLQTRLVNLLENGQLDWVITGANLGIEQWACELAIALRKKYPLRVSIITPYEDFAHRWNETNQTKFINLTQKVDFFASTSNQAYYDAVQLRNYQNFMLLHTDAALMVYDAEYPGKAKYDYDLIRNYQQTTNYPLELIDFYDLQDAAEEYRDQEKNQF